LFFLLASLAISAIKTLRTTSFESDSQRLLTILLAGGILAASVHACLSGVMVMPASQLTGMLMCGWFLGNLLLKPAQNEMERAEQYSSLKFGASILTLFLVTSLSLLAFSVHENTVRVENLNQTQVGERLLPRFWQIGKMCGI